MPKELTSDQIALLKRLGHPLDELFLENYRIFWEAQSAPPPPPQPRRDPSLDYTALDAQIDTQLKLRLYEAVAARQESDYWFSSARAVSEAIDVWLQSPTTEAAHPGARVRLGVDIPYAQLKKFEAATIALIGDFKHRARARALSSAIELWLQQQK